MDIVFDARRNEVHAEYMSRIGCGDDTKVKRLLDKLAALGISRSLPRWERGEAPAYPRAIGPTLQAKPAWKGEAKKADSKKVTELKRQTQAALTAVQKVSNELLSELKAKYRAIDEAHTAALWARVRDLFDYPVFVAAPKTVGITSTGETGEGVANELPELLKAYQDFERWLERGGKAEETPNFLVPSAA